MILIKFRTQCFLSLLWLQCDFSHYALGRHFTGYASYNVKAIALIAGLIGFSYTVVAGFFYATLVNDIGFGEWLRAGGLEITCLMAAGLALYSVMVLPLLLPKERPL